MYMQNKIFIFLDGGFANRMNAILSGFYVAKLINYDFVICWPQNTWCQASFHDIFSNINFTIIDDLETINQLLKKQDSAIIFENTTTKEELFQQMDINKEQNIYFKNCLIPSWISKNDCAILFREMLYINKSITDVVNEFISTKLSEPYYGIHIRNTDITIGLNTNEVMHITQLYKDRKFFLCSDSSASEDTYSKTSNIIIRKKEEYPEKIFQDQAFDNGIIHQANTENEKITLNINRSKNATIDGVIDLLILVNSTIIGYSGSTFQQLAKDLQPVINYTNTDRLENIDFIESATIQKLFEQTNAIDLQTFVKVISKYERQSKIDIFIKSLQYFKGGDLLVIKYNLAVELIPIQKEIAIQLLKSAIAMYPAFTQAVELLATLENTNKTNKHLKLLVRGWKDINHSIALVNQFQLLELSKMNNIQLYHQNMPYFLPTWSAANNDSGLTEQQKKILSKIIDYTDETVDVVFNISSPNELSNINVKNVTFMVTEYGLDIADGHKYTDNDNCVVTPSLWSKNKLVTSGLNPNKIFVIPHGVDRNLFYPLTINERKMIRQSLNIQEDDFVFMNVAGPFHNKGVDILVRAFCELSKTIKNIKLVLKYNENLYKIPFLNYLQSLNIDFSEDVLEKIILITNNYSLQELRLLYGICDLYVSPYRAEGFNLPVIEAMACGIKTLVTYGGSTDDFILPGCSTQIKSTIKYTNNDNASTYYLEPDFEDLKCKMTLAVTNAKLPNTYDLHAFLDKFSWKNVTNKLCDVFM